MGDYDDPDLVGRAPAGRMLPVLLALGALAVGLVAGYLLRAGTEPPAPVAAPPTTVVAPPPPPPTAPPSPCVAIAQGGTELIAELERAVRAIGALDPTELRGVLDEIQRLRTELQNEVDACQSQVGGTTGPGTPGEPIGPPPAVPPPTG